MSDRKRVTAAVLFRDGKVLVAQRGTGDPLADKWEFPGGKIEPGESPEVCLKRELQEELGIDASVGEYLCSSFFDYHHISIELMAYTCDWVSGQLEKKEHQNLLWVEPSKLKSLDMAPADWPIVDNLLGRHF